MNQRGRRLLGLSVIAASVLPFVLLGIFRYKERPQDPSYGGEPLSKHLYTIYGPELLFGTSGHLTSAEIARIQLDMQRRNNSRQLLLDRLGVQTDSSGRRTRFGAEAVPLITNWIAATPPGGWRSRAARYLARFFPGLAVDRSPVAWQFLGEFPIALEDPQLSLFRSGIESTNALIRGFAAQALSRQVAAGMPVDRERALEILMPLSFYGVKGADERISRYSFAYGGNFQDNIGRVIDALDPTRDLIPLYVLEIGPIPARVGAAKELARRPRYSDRAIPLLLSNLNSANRSVIESCAIALGAYGADAEAAVPSLERLRDHPREAIRTAARNALAAIRSVGGGKPAIAVDH